MTIYEHVPPPPRCNECRRFLTPERSSWCSFCQPEKHREESLRAGPQVPDREVCRGVAFERKEGRCSGAWTLEGTRMTVDVLRSLYTNGVSSEDIQKLYPHLTFEQVEAAVALPAQLGARWVEDRDDNERKRVLLLETAIKSILITDERGQGVLFKEAMTEAARLIGWQGRPANTGSSRHEWSTKAGPVVCLRCGAPGATVPHEQVPPCPGESTTLAPGSTIRVRNGWHAGHTGKVRIGPTSDGYVRAVLDDGKDVLFRLADVEDLGVATIGEQKATASAVDPAGCNAPEHCETGGSSQLPGAVERPPSAPETANYEDARPHCGEKSPSRHFVCTRALGHHGVHRAFGGRGDPMFESWPQAPAPTSTAEEARRVLARAMGPRGIDVTEEMVVALAAEIERANAVKAAKAHPSGNYESLKELWDEQCAQIAEMCKFLGAPSEAMPDAWTLRDMLAKSPPPAMSDLLEDLAPVPEDELDALARKVVGKLALHLSKEAIETVRDALDSARSMERERMRFTRRNGYRPISGRDALPAAVAGAFARTDAILGWQRDACRREIARLVEAEQAYVAEKARAMVDNSYPKQATHAELDALARKS